MNENWIPTSSPGRRGRHRAAPGALLEHVLAITTLALVLGGVGMSSVATEPPDTDSWVASANRQTFTIPDVEPTGDSTTLQPVELAEADRPDPDGSSAMMHVGLSAVTAAGAEAGVEAQPKELAFMLNDEGVVVAVPVLPDDLHQVSFAATTSEAPQPSTETTAPAADFGKPTLWLDSFAVSALATGGLPAAAPPVVNRPRPTDARGCYMEAREIDLSIGRNGIAQMIHTLFDCLARVEGLETEPATSSRRWDGAGTWGFESLADQVGAEAVVVAYCESLGFAGHAVSGNNPWGYGGLFQMGNSEMRRFGGPGLSKFDPVDNAYAAANYFFYQRRTGAGWGGWSPWAVVNTNFNDAVNDQVKVPILPRFTSTDPKFKGRRGPELPQWAVDPWLYHVPGWDGCPYSGRWPAAQPLG